MDCSGARLSCRDFRFSQPLQRLHQAAAQSLTPEKSPLLELGAIRKREAGEKITVVKINSFLKGAAITVALEAPGIHVGGKHRIQAEGRPIRCDNLAAEGNPNLVQRPPKACPRLRRLRVRPQQRGNALARDRSTATRRGG